MQSVRKIIEAVKESETPLIAIGDFNSTPSSFPSAECDSDGQNAMDVLLESQHFAVTPESVPIVAGMTYSSMKPDRVIDWILIPKTWSFSNHRVILSDLSDHRPVVADLLINVQ